MPDPPPGYRPCRGVDGWPHLGQPPNEPLATTARNCIAEVSAASMIIPERCGTSGSSPATGEEETPHEANDDHQRFGRPGNLGQTQDSHAVEGSSETPPIIKIAGRTGRPPGPKPQAHGPPGDTLDDHHDISLLRAV